MIFRGIIAVIVLFFASWSAYSRSTEASCTIESPVDGSLWIGTNSEGIFRLGRNGKSVHYSIESGHLQSDCIVSLAFDNNNVLWILDTTGHFTKYSYLTGFEAVLSFPDNTACFTLSANREFLYLCTLDQKFYRYSVAQDSLDSPVALPFVATSIIPSVEDSSLWILSSESTVKINADGSLSSWEEGGVISNLLPFVFETNVPQSAANGRNRHAALLYLLLVVLFVSIAYLIYRYLLQSRLKRRTVSYPQPIVVEKISENEKSSGISTDTLDRPVSSISHARVPLNISEDHTSSGFTKTVLDLIDQNLSNPEFDVDSIAETTGMSRIHVNRKLKSEGSPSPSVLIKDARMAKAASLLKASSMTVAQVCKLCGFSRPSYFATAFKEYFGVTPSDFIESSK